MLKVEELHFHTVLYFKTWIPPVEQSILSPSWSVCKDLNHKEISLIVINLRLEATSFHLPIISHSLEVRGYEKPEPTAAGNYVTVAGLGREGRSSMEPSGCES